MILVSNAILEENPVWNKDSLTCELRCPICKIGQFSFKERLDTFGNGSIQCRNCGEVVCIIDGIYHFYKDRGSLSGIDYTQPDWPGREREREKKYEREHGFSHEWVRSLPYPTIETETTFQKKGGALGKNFFDVVDRLNLCGTEYVFDMGAGCCWTSNEFSKRGCKVISTDIRTIKYHGLRSAEAYFEEGISFERLCWAYGRIPFDDATFDIVFCQNAFQYVEDLPYMMREVHRVMKPNGKFVLSWTGVRAPFKSKQWGPGYYLTEYLRQARKCGFSINVFPPISLFGYSGEFAVRNHFGGVAAKVFSLVLKKSSEFRQFFVRIFVPVNALFGAPFNMIAYKSPIN